MDARALRLAAELPDLKWFEVDAPATQRVKLAALRRAAGAEGGGFGGGASGFSSAAACDGSGVRYLPWDFEKHPPEEIPSALR